MKRKANKGSVWILTGLLLMAAALLLTIYNVRDDARVKQSTDAAVAELKPVILKAVEKTAATQEKAEAFDAETDAPVPEQVFPDYVLNPDMEMPELELNGVRYIGMLTIPGLELELPVVSEWSYDNLKYGPCRYVGSVYRNDLIICAHNYTAHFRELKNLPLGAEVVFADVDGNVFRYHTVEMETVEPDDVERMKAGEWDLTVFTCTIGGAYRVTVRCELD